MQKALDIAELVENAAELAPLPASTTRLATLLSGSDWEIEEVVEIITFDQALTARMLRGANSALSASVHTISSVEEAVMRLGAGTVLSMVVSANVGKSLRESHPSYGLEEGKLWRHSVAAALAVEALRRPCRRTIPPVAATTALLHDVGKLILCRFLTPETYDSLQKAIAAGRNAIHAERDLFELDHGELGGLLAQKWHLPEDIAHGIIYHHTPEDSGDLLPHIARVADAMAHALPGQEPAVGALECGGFPASLEAIGLDEEGYRDATATLATRFEELIGHYDGG